jgi:hypothetical protein
VPKQPLWHVIFRSNYLDLKKEEGARCHGIQAASRMWKRQGNVFFSPALRRIMAVSWILASPLPRSDLHN